MPNALHEALEQVDRRYDAIIVDEGQDFRSTFWAGITPPQIIILSPLESRSHWKDGMRVGQFTLSRGTKCPPDHIAVETIFAFKGLERPVVILTELGRWLPEDRDSLLYVALSRARNHLIVLGKLPDPEGTAPEADS